jgi:Ferritin-like
VETFLDIELPLYDDPVSPPDGWATIGEFYEEIIALTRKLSDTDFQSAVNSQASDESNPVLDQNGYYAGPGSGTIYRVRSVAGAIAAMNEIMLQGEGVKTWDRDAPNELAHYYQFQRILKSMQPGGDWVDYQNDVYPMVSNPASSLSKFPPNAIELNNTVNALFSQLLDQLHTAFNGTNTDNAIQTAVGTMLQLQTPAQQLMQVALTDGSGNCGPTFDYISPAAATKPQAETQGVNAS